MRDSRQMDTCSIVAVWAVDTWVISDDWIVCQQLYLIFRLAGTRLARLELSSQVGCITLLHLISPLLLCSPVQCANV